jgi:HAD superfamily hydrolase (TIGR01509 family)
MNRFEVPKAIIFDLDGTLIDTAPEFIRIIMHMRENARLPAIDPQEILAVVSDGAVGMIQAGFDISADDDRFETLRQQFLAAYARTLGQYSRPYAGLTELIKQCGERRIHWGVVTNKMRQFAEPLMKKMALNPQMGCLITPCDVQHPKPDPTGILMCCEALSVAPEHAVYIGDHLRDIEAGIRAGCRTVAAAYGYVNPSDDIESWGADHIVFNSTELEPLLLEPALGAAS